MAVSADEYGDGAVGRRQADHGKLRLVAYLRQQNKHAGAGGDAGHATYSSALRQVRLFLVLASPPLPEHVQPDSDAEHTHSLGEPLERDGPADEPAHQRTDERRGDEPKRTTQHDWLNPPRAACQCQDGELLLVSRLHHEDQFKGSPERREVQLQLPFSKFMRYGPT